MAYVKQQGKTDCGVAALAMLCDVDYDTALKAIPFRRQGLLGGTTTKQLREGALKLDYLTDSTPQHRLKVVREPHDWRYINTNPSISDYWYLIPNNSLVKVKFDSTPHSHWVVWKKEKIYDPACGVFHPSKYPNRPLSYMQFITLEVM